MAVYRVERTRDYTVMSNHHLKDKTLSLKAKGLLSMMLSMPDDWDYSTRGFVSICKEGVEAIGSTLKELEKMGYVVRRKLRDKKGRITDTEYIIYEIPQTQEPTAAEPAPEPDEPEPVPASSVDPDTAAPEPEEPDTPNPDTAVPDTVPPDTDSPYPASPYPGNPDVVKPDAENRPELNIYKTNTQKLNTYSSSTHSFSPSCPPIVPAVRTEGMTEVNAKRAEILEQIDYNRIVNLCNREQLNEFVEIMLEVALAKNPTIKIGRGQEYPTALVQQRFELINSGHIEKILDAIRENTTRVWNTKAYLMAALFNAPSTTDNHYTMLVNHDLNSDG